MALPEDRASVVAKHVFGAGVVVAEGGQSEVLAFGQALHLALVGANLEDRVKSQIAGLCRVEAEGRC